MHQYDTKVSLKFDKNKTEWASFYLFGPDGELMEFTFQNSDLKDSNKHIKEVDVQSFLKANL